MVCKLFDKKTTGGVVIKEVEKLHKPTIRKFEKRKSTALANL